MWDTVCFSRTILFYGETELLSKYMCYMKEWDRESSIKFYWNNENIYLLWQYNILYILMTVLIN
jgi:hypothetical protein